MVKKIPKRRRLRAIGELTPANHRYGASRHYRCNRVTIGIVGCPFSRHCRCRSTATPAASSFATDATRSRMRCITREILRASETYLNEVCRLGYRTESILAFCRDACEGRFDPEALDAMASDPNVGSDDLLAQLRSIRGIGPSSAHYLLGFLGRHDRLSIDSATIAHVAQMHTHGRKPTPNRIERIYAPYGRWKNLVYWCENWLTWATAAGILREAGLPRPGAEAISQRS